MIEKHGSPNRITKLVKSSEEFEKIREDISSENNLVRCPTCNHLIAKSSSDGYLDFQHKKANILVNNPKSISAKCPVCGSIINIS
jgi:phage FluMu protein Com